jgi:hypothetical protein
VSTRRPDADAGSRAVSRAAILGPLSPGLDLEPVVASLEIHGPVALVTAGWQEREDDDRAIRRGLEASAVNLRLYRRTEEVAALDPELAAAHRRLQERLKLLRRSYNLRLGHLLDALISLQSLEGDPAILGPERQAALAQVRELDRAHVAHVGELRGAFEARYRPGEREALARHREEVARALDEAGGVVIAGGHVAVLANRLRLFGMDRLLAGRVVIAWSAGAMALSSRIVLFHDSPPWGPGHPEAFDVGLGVFPDLVPLPHASRRLRLGDPGRVARLALRFGPDLLAALEPGDRLDWDGGGWRSRSRIRRLSPRGTLEEIGR